MRYARLASTLALGLGLSGALVGCSDDDEKVNVDQFLGAWTVTAGSLTPANCMNLPAGVSADALTLPLTGGTVQVTKASDKSVAVNLVAGCALEHEVKGTTALIKSGAACNTTFQFPYMGAQVPAMITLTPGSGSSIAINPATNQATVMGTGKVAATVVIFNVSCDYTVNANLVRGAADAGAGG